VARRYEDPPVVEALCEIIFDGSVWKGDIPDAFHERIRARFPARTPVARVGAEFEIAPQQASARVTQGEPRWQFARDDRSMIVQLERDLLVVNQLRPYPRFEEWRPVVVEMLAEYRALAQPKTITRLGVRYLNRVVIRETTFDIEKYFRIYPEIPNELNPHGNFLLRVELPPVHQGHELIVTFGDAPPEEPNAVAMLLDIFDNSPKWNADAFELVERRLDEAHSNIVAAFESAITSEARKLFREVK
jgi:uncharacterized protein (TIGR04255 family)